MEVVRKWYFSLGVLTLIAFVFLSFNFTSDLVVQFDKVSEELLRGNEFFHSFQYIGESMWIVSAALVLILFLAFRRVNHRGMLFVLIAVGGGNYLNHMLKDWVQRSNPDISTHLISLNYPSDQAMVGLLYLFTYAYFFTNNNTSIKWCFGIWFSAILLTLFVGLSQIVSGYYSTDVIAGWLSGYTFFIIVVIWYEWRNRNMKKRIVQPE
ncbi:phosphatase PAP2 family protein [Paenisporosarcina sp. TG20]|uniref:phosphatase PAP2 family protein n=1 Tax=Paenisporosarcina sp. TG20 TaxID=1211706 RepID=UPI00036D60DD|nr:phosphatase PAP2 family protein [Paenisporosarcina sp. TG20]